MADTRGTVLVVDDDPATVELLADYLIGTALGLAPGLAAMSLLGDQLVRILAGPTFFDIGVLVAVVIAWIGLSVALQPLLARARARRR